MAAGPGGDQVRRREDPGPNRLGGGVGVVEDQNPTEGHAHRDDRRGGDDRPGVLEEVGRERRPVEAEVDEHGQDCDAEDRQREDVGPEAGGGSARHRCDRGEDQHREVDREAASVEDRREGVLSPPLAPPSEELGLTAAFGGGLGWTPV